MYGYFEDQDTITLLIEQCNDADYFQKKIEEKHKGIANEAKLKHYASQILEALAYVHSLGVVHADMKPGNILLQRPSNSEKLAGKWPTAKLSDFGISQIDINIFCSGSDLQKLDDEIYQKLKNRKEGGWKAIMRERSGTHGYIAPEIKS